MSLSKSTFCPVNLVQRMILSMPYPAFSPCRANRKKAMILGLRGTDFTLPGLSDILTAKRPGFWNSILSLNTLIVECIGLK